MGVGREAGGSFANHTVLVHKLHGGKEDLPDEWDHPHRLQNILRTRSVCLVSLQSTFIDHVGTAARYMGTSSSKPDTSRPQKRAFEDVAVFEVLMVCRFFRQFNVKIEGPRDLCDENINEVGTNETAAPVTTILFRF
jgi:hypothetical protein